MAHRGPTQYHYTISFTSVLGQLKMDVLEIRSDQMITKRRETHGLFSASEKVDYS